MSTQAHDNPHTVIGRLQEIADDLAQRQNFYEEAARARAVSVRNWEKKLAQCRLVAEGKDADSRKANALLAAVASDGTYEELTNAEGAYEAAKAVMKVLEVRASIGMSILRAQGRA